MVCVRIKDSKSLVKAMQRVKDTEQGVATKKLLKMLLSERISDSTKYSIGEDVKIVAWEGNRAVPLSELVLPTQSDNPAEREKYIKNVIQNAKWGAQSLADALNKDPLVRLVWSDATESDDSLRVKATSKGKAYNIQVDTL